jgi:hemerythrin-like domain-containing protein/uncharacterized protein (DUF2249 family)
VKAVNRIETSDGLTQERRAEIFGAFDSLSVGQALELVVRGGPLDPRLLADFEDRYANSFDWWPVDCRADVCHVWVRKRAAGEPRAIASFLGADHQRLTELWDEAMGAIERSDAQTVRDLLGQFIFGLRRHIRLEEEVAFPAFEQVSGMPQGAGPTAMMRMEHQEIKAILEAIEKGLGSADCAGVTQAIDSQPTHPMDVLGSHDDKEENILYPMIDRFLDVRRVGDLIRAMQAL